ncbi:MAG: peptidase family protein [Acidimicrobiales bacterium]|nr:peptidase family protein [Acidimicrobiales bacterium]
MARVLGGIGRTLISAGVLILLFVAYEVWGTNLQEASAQRQLSRDFNAALQHAPATRPTTTSTTAPKPTTTVPKPGLQVTTATTPPAPAAIDLPVPTDGAAMAEIQIPKIGVDKTVVQGVTLDQLKRGPGHYPGTPLPGQKGNAAIAGHRTTYGAPFHNIDKVAVGDDIIIITTYGTFHYKVDSSIIVSPNASEVLLDKGDARITLTACHPKYSAEKRIVVSGVLVGRPIPPFKGQDQFMRQHQSSSGAGNTATIDGGLSGIKESKTPAFLWGALAALVWLAAWAVSRVVGRRGAGRLLRWAPYLVGTPVFLVVLYVFFENFSRLLPANF